MKSLKDLVDIICNNEECVVLKVKPKVQTDLICLGCFNGNETLLRLTKGQDVTCTVFTNDDRSCSWHWGLNGYTLVSDSLNKKGRMIQHCIENDFKIKCLY